MAALRVLRVKTTGQHSNDGVDNYSRIEASRNIWENNGLKIDSANTDVAWARARTLIPMIACRDFIKHCCEIALDSKIVTSARNGELILWDVNRTKYGLYGCS
jgi:WD repeat-containing protein 24